MLLSYCIMPYSKPNSSLSSGVGTNIKTALNVSVSHLKTVIAGLSKCFSVTQMLHHKNHYV